MGKVARGNSSASRRRAERARYCSRPATTSGAWGRSAGQLSAVPWVGLSTTAPATRPFSATAAPKTRSSSTL